MSDFIGAGWAYPVRVAPRTRGIALNTGHQRIEQAIRIILGTAPGERPIRPEFGCGINELPFAPLDTRLLVRIEREVRTALTRWEPRIALRSVRAAVDSDEIGRVNISIDYLVRSTNDPRNLVFPFYSLSVGRP